MAASDLTTVAFIIQHDYSGRMPPDIAMRDHPAFMSINKDSEFPGDTHNYAIKYQNGQGISGTFANAQANAKAMSGKQLAVARTKKYGVYTISGELLAVTRNNKATFMKAVTREVDGMLKEMGDALAFDLHRDTTGIRGRRASISGNTVTLTDAADARNFKINMTVGADDTATGLSPRVGTTYVTAVNLKDGKITLNNAAGIALFADNDYMFRDGDPGTCMEGFAVLTPLTAPDIATDSFRGINRGSYPELLAGVRVDDTSSTIEQNVGLVGVQIGVNSAGSSGRECWINPINFYTVTRRLNAKVEYQDAGGMVKWGFQYCMIVTPAGSIKLVSDPDVPLNRFEVVNPENHFLKHQDPLPHIIEDDGRPTLRAAAADDIEGRGRCFVNYIQDDPSNFGIGSI